MFKVFFLFSFFFIHIGNAYAQTSFSASKDDQEKALSQYINASAVCAKMTDIEALYERGMLLISDANDEAFLAAADCFTSAAMKNHTPSQLELGKLYEFGKGVTQSNIFAYKWYQTAVLLGNQDAIPFRNRLEARMSLDEISSANPMIKTTLDLIDSFNQREQEDLEALEKDIAQEYLKFGVDISKYDIKDDDESSSYDNPLIDSLIQEQKKKGENNKEEDDSPQKSRRRR
ncbi:MAG: sel1 repeat family protein [Alphaproteobacteria bacterium]|nr:sel1 repeat family protein [Alphaproteobacteria bacterium]MBO4644231.1 sel1 repeat family protein [Alphaproteobacteria bacterium]